MGSTGIVISDIVHFSNHPLYCDMYIYIYTVNPQLSEPRLSGSSIIRITKSPCTRHMDYAIITPTHIHSIYSLCIFSRTRVFFA